MGVTYDKAAFRSVKRKIKKTSSLAEGDGILERIANAVANRGASILKERYASSGVVGISVSVIPASNGRAYINANGSHVAYIEFGTGAVGEGTYSGETPTQGVPITGSWVYNYPSPHKVPPNTENPIGWYFGKLFLTGRTAGNQIYDTARQLENEVREIVASVLKGES